MAGWQVLVVSHDGGVVTCALKEAVLCYRGWVTVGVPDGVTTGEEGPLLLPRMFAMHAGWSMRRSHC